MWAAMAGRSRTSVRKAERLGYVTEVRSATLNDLKEGSPFRALYTAAMDRRSAAEHYYFTDRYYAGLIAMESDVILAVTRAQSGEPVAAALFMVHGDYAHYHLSGATLQAGRDGATNQLIWSVMKSIALRQDVRRFHLGGGVVADDSLMKFKLSFGGQRVTYRADGVVIIPEAYDELTRRASERLGRDVMADTFFPHYRMTS